MRHYDPDDPIWTEVDDREPVDQDGPEDDRVTIIVTFPDEDAVVTYCVPARTAAIIVEELRMLEACGTNLVCELLEVPLWAR